MSTLIKDSNGEWKQAAGNYSVWSGTRAELEAALAGGTIPNGTVAVVTDDYAMQGVSCVPDWDHAVTVTGNQLYDGYTCPDNGLMVINFNRPVALNASGYTYINGIKVVRAFCSSGWDEFGQLQCPVGKGDVVSTSLLVVGEDDMASFVPWKK